MWGGGIRNLDCSPTLVNALFDGNSASKLGGAIYTSFGEPIITNCTVANNSAGTRAGGVRSDNNSHLYLDNCILWGNTSGENIPDQVSNEEIPGDPTISSYTELHYSLLQNGCSGFGATCYEVQLTTNPLFVNPAGVDGIIGTLDDNLRLLPGSPAINAGGNSLVQFDDLDINYNGIIAETMPYDLDNNSRFIGTVDLGAYEAEIYLYLPVIRK